MKLLPQAFTLFCIVALAGCSSDPTIKASVPEQQLQRSVERVEVEVLDELRLLAKLRDEERMKKMTEEEKRQRIIQARSDKWPDEFKQRTSMNIPPKHAHEVCTMIADAVGYESVIEGPRPRKPIWVRINVRDEPISSAVMELGRQTGESFVMEIYGLSDLVRCVYQREINT